MSSRTRMIAALYSARCTLTSEIEVKDNGSGNWLINPREAKGYLSNAASSCMLFKWSAKKKRNRKRKPDAFLHEGVSDRRAKGLNLPCQAPKICPRSFDYSIRAAVQWRSQRGRRTVSSRSPQTHFRGMRLYITAIYAWQAARNNKELTTRPFAFVLHTCLSLLRRGAFV